MNYSPIITDEQRKKDQEHLTLLAIFHFVISGLALVALLFLAVHFLVMSTVFAHPEMWQPNGGFNNGFGGPPPAFFHLMIWFYAFTSVVLVIMGLLNVFSGLFLRQRRYRMFSLVVAGLDCFQIPFGTALGVFTIIVLLRDSVRQAYGE